MGLSYTPFTSKMVVKFNGKKRICYLPPKTRVIFYQCSNNHLLNIFRDSRQLIVSHENKNKILNCLSLSVGLVCYYRSAFKIG